jgi:hypothetical protein
MESLDKDLIMRNSKYDAIDIFKMFPTNVKEEVSDAAIVAVSKREQLLSDKNIKTILIGSKDGPEFLAYYCENSRMFLPPFKR